MRFDLLKARVVAHIRARVRSGELTERGVARLAGISQPHLHHILKGARLLSTGMADRLVEALDLSLFDFLERHEWAAPEGEGVPVPLLEAPLGPAFPWHFQKHPREFLPFPSRLLARVGDPVVAILGADPRMEPLVRAGDLALLDRSEAARREPRPAEHYVVQRDAHGLVRVVRCGHDRLYLAALDNPNPLPWDFISLLDRNILEVVKARVVWIGRIPEPPESAAESSESTG
jgi:hypothetical protein